MNLKKIGAIIGSTSLVTMGIVAASTFLGASAQAALPGPLDTTTPQAPVAFVPGEMPSYITEPGFLPGPLVQSSTSYATFTLSYDANGGSNAPAPDSCVTGPTFTPWCEIQNVSPQIPVKPGYTFMGWKDVNSVTGNPQEIYQSGQEVYLSESGALVAQWAYNQPAPAQPSSCSNGRNVVTNQNLRLSIGQWMPSGASDGSVGLSIASNGQLMVNHRGVLAGVGVVGNSYWSFQADGNVVEYNASTGAIMWASGTRIGNNVGNYVTVQCDGNVVVYHGNNPAAPGLVLVHA